MPLSAENISKSEPNPSDVRSEPSNGSEFFGRWLHRKQERELTKSAVIEREAEKARDVLPATRLSRLIHKLDINPVERSITLRRDGLEFSRVAVSGELQVDHRNEQVRDGLSSKRASAQEKLDKQEDTDNLEEAVFDLRHEQLDHAMPLAKSFATTPNPDYITASSSQHPTQLAAILADKPYAQAQQAKVPIATDSPQQPALKGYRLFVLYGFLAGLAVVLLIAIFSYL